MMIFSGENITDVFEQVEIIDGILSQLYHKLVRSNLLRDLHK